MAYHHRQQLSLSVLMYIFYFTLPSVKSQEMFTSHQAVLSILKSEAYSSNLAPVSSAPLKVFLNLGLREIEKIDDTTMELKTQLSFRQKWMDPRLIYRSADPNDHVTLNADIAHPPWTPDIFVQNEKGSLIHSLTPPSSYFRLYPNGTLVFSTRLTLTLSCLMNLRRFPFDRQTCYLRLASFGYDKDVMELVWDSDAAEKSPALGSQHLTQFRVVGQASGRCLLESAAGQFSSVYVALAFKRQVAYYCVQVFIPCSMLVIFTWVSFWFENAMEARLSLTVTVLLTLSTQIFGAGRSVAQVSYQTGFSIFCGTCMTFAFAAILQTATVFFVRRNGVRVLLPLRKRGVEMELMNPRRKDLEECGGIENGDIVEPGRLTAERMDIASRALFPVAFAFFVGIFFGTYMWDFGDEECLGEMKMEGMEDHNMPCVDWEG